MQVVANKTSHDIGYENIYNWALSIYCQFHQTGMGTCTLRGVSGLLKDMGLSYTRPTYILKKANKEKQEDFKKESFQEF